MLWLTIAVVAFALVALVWLYRHSGRVGLWTGDGGELDDDDAGVADAARELRNRTQEDA